MRNRIVAVAMVGLFGLAFAPVQGESLGNLFRKPGVMGDSLSQGFFGVTVESKTQNWAYPVIVSKQAGSSVTYNKLKGPFVNLEDVLKLRCGPICIIKAIIGGNDSTVGTPTHAGITGGEYTSVLQTSGSCVNIYAKKWEKYLAWDKRTKKVWFANVTYWVPVYKWREVADCQKPDKFHEFGLRGSGTQMQIIEKVQPSFVFAAVGANHVLCTALGTSLDCLDEARFRRDFSEVMRRLRAIPSVRGGVIFTVPNVTAIAYLRKSTSSKGAAYSGLKAFYRTEVKSPDQVLDNSEVAKIETFLTMLNNELTNQARASNYAVADARAIFDDIKENGRPVPGTGKSAQADWPLPGKPGIFGLDGVHPNMYGHTVLANELIKVINTKYGVSIPSANEYYAYKYDSLNQNPVDLLGFLQHNIIGQMIGWLVNIFA